MIISILSKSTQYAAVLLKVKWLEKKSYSLASSYLMQNTWNRKDWIDIRAYMDVYANAYGYTNSKPLAPTPLA